MLGVTEHNAHDDPAAVSPSRRSSAWLPRVNAVNDSSPLRDRTTGLAAPSSPTTSRARSRARNSTGPQISFPYQHNHHNDHLQATDAAGPTGNIPFSRGAHRSGCDACKLRAERIAEAKAHVQTIKSDRKSSCGTLPPWRPVGSSTPIVTVRAAVPHVTTTGVPDRGYETASPQQPLRGTTGAVTSRVDSGLRAPDGSIRKVSGWKKDVVAPASMPARPPWNPRPLSAFELRTTAQPVVAKRRLSAPKTRPSSIFLAASTAAEPSYVISSPVKVPKADAQVHVTNVHMSAPVEQEVVVSEPVDVIALSLVVPSVSGAISTEDVQEAACEILAVETHALDTTPILPRAAALEIVGDAECAQACLSEDSHMHIALDEIKVPVPVPVPAESQPKAPSPAPVSEPIAVPLYIPPRRPRVDISNLTAVSTHLQTAADSMLGLHRTLRSSVTTNAERVRAKAEYIHDSGTLTHLSRDLCKSYSSPAEKCSDATLRHALRANLEQVDVLNAQLAGVTRRKAADCKDWDTDGSVLACAQNLLGACLKAVDALNAVGIILST
ncbi:hypothetical protein BDZ88DRAFT_430154 [Geranomyces variabilis]|nr:hypothetical protein BDZ88DRAFT_430154 [Geranomyces variabilis]KAJ3131915.1 hypothetical protein HDU90_007662 [Geranomyces variabilis]